MLRRRDERQAYQQRPWGAPVNNKVYPKIPFNVEIKSLETDITHHSDAEITLRLMRLVASANAAHTNVRMPLFKLGLHRLPLTLHWYTDGLAITGTAPEYRSALG